MKEALKKAVDVAGAGPDLGAFYLNEYKKTCVEYSEKVRFYNKVKDAAMNICIKHRLCKTSGDWLYSIKKDFLQSLYGENYFKYKFNRSAVDPVPYSKVKEILKSKPYAGIFADVLKCENGNFSHRVSILENRIKLLKYLYMPVLANSVIDYLEDTKQDLTKIHYKRFIANFGEKFPGCTLFTRQYTVTKYIELSFDFNCNNYTTIEISDCHGNLQRPEIKTVNDIDGEIIKAKNAYNKIYDVLKEAGDKIDELKTNCFYSVINDGNNHFTRYY